MKRFDQINVIPFIDIMLVMLAIVLTTATFIAQEKIPLELPDAENTHSQKDKDPIKIAIDKDEKFYYRGALIEFETLKEKLSVLKTEDPILLSVDKSVRFERFIEMIDALKTYQLNNLSIAAHHDS
jgi:biopolymer transport protein ExbD